MIYHHTCTECGQTTELDMTISEYDELEEDFGLAENGNRRIPCDNVDCKGWSERDYGFGVAASIVKGGTLYQTKRYRAGAEEEWIRNEIGNSKKVLKHGSATHKGKLIRPYTNYAIKDPEAAGFKKVDQDTARARADAAKKTVGEKWNKVENARKK